MTRFIKSLCLGALILSILLAAGCSSEGINPFVPSKTVTYKIGNQIHATEKVQVDNYPVAAPLQIEGVAFLGWQDGAGNPVDPTTVAVTEDITYTARFRVLLGQHAPFIALDAKGNFRPNDPLTGQELSYGLQCLSAEAAWPFLPEIPQDESVTQQQLQTVLQHFFDAAEVEQVLATEIGDTVTRADFARCMYRLLGRLYDERFVLDAGEKIPEDLRSLGDDPIALLEACLKHTDDPTGKTWEDMDLYAGWSTGFHNTSGYLYYLQEDGTLLRNGYKDELYFGSNGRFTSGDPVLDRQVAGILKKILEENPDLEGLELLRKVYDHCHQDYKYVRKKAYDFGATGWEMEDAKAMFSSGRGNCYGFAAIFWALAQGLGYDVQCLAGTCTGSYQPHGWVVMHYQGEHYFVDPEWQYAYTEREEYHKDMFMLTMDRVWWWTYRWDKTAF